MEYSVSFDDKPIAAYASFEFAMIAAKHLSSKLINEPIFVRSTFFTYTFINGVEV